MVVCEEGLTRFMMVASAERWKYLGVCNECCWRLPPMFISSRKWTIKGLSRDGPAASIYESSMTILLKIDNNVGFN